MNLIATLILNMITKIIIIITFYIVKLLLFNLHFTIYEWQYNIILYLNLFSVVLLILWLFIS